MDAGLAGVLGAAVGAVGTGGAAAITALLSRSQARTQVEAEHNRLLAESRRTSYVAFAEAYTTTLRNLLNAAHSLTSAINAPDNETRATRLEKAQEAYDQAGTSHDLMDHLEAAVYVEGPHQVRTACAVAGAELHEYRTMIIKGISNILNQNPQDEEVEDLEGKYTKCSSLYF